VAALISVASTNSETLQVVHDLGESIALVQDARGTSGYINVILLEIRKPQMYNIAADFYQQNTH
jgi:hypothetical protein